MDKRTELNSKLKSLALNNLGKIGKGFKDKADKDREPGLIDKNRDKIVSSLKSANSKVRKEVKEVSNSISKPNKVNRFKKWIKNGAYNKVTGSLDAAKSVAKEGRETIIAGKIVKRGLIKKDLSKHEKHFVKEQGKDVVKGTVGAAIVGGSVGLSIANPLVPFITEAGIGVTKALNLKVGKQKIPHKYRNHNKMTKFNNWVDKKSKAIRKSKREYNRAYDKKNPDDKTYSYDPKLTRDARVEKLQNILHNRTRQANIAMTAGSGFIGGVLGNSLGKSLSSKLYKKKRSRLSHLESKGYLSTENEQKEISDLKKFLSKLDSNLSTGGTALGSVGGVAAYLVSRNKMDKNDKKSKWRPEKV